MLSQRWQQAPHVAHEFATRWTNRLQSNHYQLRKTASDLLAQVAHATTLDQQARSSSQATMSMRAQRQQKVSTTGLRLACSLRLTSVMTTCLLLRLLLQIVQPSQQRVVPSETQRHHQVQQLGCSSQHQYLPSLDAWPLLLH